MCIRDRVAFPWTMIDKITPRPGQDVLKILEEDGLTGMEPVVTAKNTYAAPFVNAEECEYLVIEDDFPNGRPALEKAGFLFTDRETVEKAEKMKVLSIIHISHTTAVSFPSHTTSLFEKFICFGISMPPGKENMCRHTDPRSVFIL